VTRNWNKIARFLARGGFFVTVLSGFVAPGSRLARPHLQSDVVRRMANALGEAGVFFAEEAAISSETSGFTAQTACRDGIFEGIVRSLESNPAPACSTPLGTGCGGQTIF